MTNFPLLFACCLATAPVETAVHEAGHWIAGRLVGIPIREVRIGGGPEIASVRLGFTMVSLRWGPWSGHVAPYPHLALPAWRAVVFSAGGSLASLTSIGLAAAALWAMPDCGQVPQTVLVAAMLNALWGAGQILPYLPWTSRERDYHHIRDALRNRGKGDPYTDWAAAMYGACVTGRYGAQPPADPSHLAPIVIYALADRSHRPASETPSNAERGSAARAFQRFLLSRRGLSAPERAALLDGLATAALLGTIEVPPSDLDGWTAELVALAPGIATARATRGSALVALGRPGGRALLERDLGGDEPAFDSAMRRVFIARALLDEGDHAGAADTLAGVDLASVGLEAEFPLLKALRAELASATSPAGDGAEGQC